jgi:hypothetical protein
MGMVVPYLINVVHVELHCTTGLLRFPHHGDRDHALFSELCV